MNSRQIRQQFLDFFASKGHEIVDSSPVVPLDDPTLMFTNAGMNQFKDVFLGTGSRPYTRVADTQKCIRAGGKHNDLDDVGQDTYHHTFFEMLGNWSFGDYFKREAIEWAWELLTDVWGIDKGRLHATYFEGDESEGLEPDTESAELWKSVTDIDPSHVHPGGKKDNFWEMGETGPCGPCSEIHIDLTPDKSGHRLVNAGDPRVIELWNLVFIQFNRDSEGRLTPLPAKHVDTGMGFERLVAVLHGMQRGRIAEVSNYDTDVFTPIFEAIQKRTGAPAYRGTLPTEPRTSVRAASLDAERSKSAVSPRGLKPPAHEGAESSDEATLDTVCQGQAPRRSDEDYPPPPPLGKGGQGGVSHDQVMIDVSYRVIADHVRCLTFALTDGGIPSNEGRGYVLRRILRRAVYYGRQYLGMEEPFLGNLVEPVVAHMADVFPGLRTNLGRRTVEYVAELIRDEEASFIKTLDRGSALVDAAARNSIATTIIDPNLPLGPSAIVGTRDTTTGELITYGNGDCVIPASPEHGRTHDIVIPPDVEGQRQVIAKYCKRQPIISGSDAFLLRATYGFPIDLTEIIAAERGLRVDVAEYERLMEEARAKARAAQEVREMIFAGDLATYTTQFVGYEEQELPNTLIWAIVRGREFVAELKAGEEGGLILLHTPFYAEQGGQLGDRGWIRSSHGAWEFRVEDTQKIGETFVHFGVCTRGVVTRRPPNPVGSGSPPARSTPAEDEARRLSEANAEVDEGRRHPTMKNHTSTHMLNWALREVLGDHIQQKGSLVDPEKTRFDFSHNKPISPEQLDRIERLVNELIEKDLQVYTKPDADKNDALKINTLRAVFGETYPDKVRVVSAGADIDAMLADPKNPKWMKYPVEFCGGTHLKRSSEAERFVLILEEGVAKGIRRLVGITGEAARQAEEAGQALLAEVRALADKPPVAPDARTPDELSTALSAFHQRVNEATIPVRVRRELQNRISALHKSLKEQQKRAASVTGGAVMDRVSALLESAEEVAGVKIVVGEVPAARPEALRSAIDWVRNKTKASAVLLATVADDNVTLIAGMSKAVVDKGISAGDLIRDVAPLIGGRGGGRPDMAQGGGNDLAGIPNALDRAKTWLTQKL